MTQPIPTTEPVAVVAGDTLVWRRSLPDFPASAGWGLTYTLVQKGFSYSVAAVADGDGFLVTIPASASEDFDLGLSYWQAKVAKGSETYTVLEGQITVRADLTAVNNSYDPRSLAKKTLDDLKAALASYAGSRGHVQEYEIAGRRMRFRSAADIEQQIKFWQREVVSEQKAERLAAGLPTRGRVMVRF